MAGYNHWTVLVSSLVEVLKVSAAGNMSSCAACSMCSCAAFDKEKYLGDATGPTTHSKAPWAPKCA